MHGGRSSGATLQVAIQAAWLNTPCGRRPVSKALLQAAGDRIRRRPQLAGVAAAKQGGVAAGRRGLQLQRRQLKITAQPALGAAPVDQGGAVVVRHGRGRF